MRITTFFLMLLGITIPSLAIENMEDVIAKHIKAKGGLANWSKIKSMKITGNYTGFSITDTFTLTKAKPNKILFDHKLNSRDMLIGFDGKEAWWFNGWMEMPVTTKVEGNDYKVLIQDAEFATPFFSYKDQNLKLSFNGEGDFDGSPSLVFEVVRNEDHKEIWHLDPDTYLEMARISPGSEFGRPITQTTIYDDFRNVQGVQIPFYTETEFHTRHRVMEIEKIEINTAISSDVFKWPVHEALSDLQIMEGTWNVTVEDRSRPQQPWQKSETTSVIEKGIRGHVFFEKTTFGQPGNQSETIRQWAYDPFKSVYRVTQINDHTTHLNLFEGTMENGLLKLDNSKTQTPWSMYGTTFHEGLQWKKEGNGFRIEILRSTDGGTNWFVNQRLTFTKP